MTRIEWLGSILIASVLAAELEGCGDGGGGKDHRLSPASQPVGAEGNGPAAGTLKVTSFKEHGKFGFKDANGKVVIKPIYDAVGEFSCGLARVNIGQRILIPVEFELGRWGYINASGTVVVPITLQNANDFSEELALVRDEQGSRYIDTSGKIALDVEKAARAGDFREGVAPIRIDRSLMNKDWQTRFIDKHGHTAIAIDGYAEEFHDGLAVLVVRDESFLNSNEKSKYGFLGRDGKVAIQPQFAEAESFNEALAAVRPKKTTVYGMGDAWGYIDKQGQYVLKPQFNEAHPFRGGIARVHVEGKLLERTDAPPCWVGGEWQLLDRKGNVLKRSESIMDYGQAVDDQGGQNHPAPPPAPSARTP